MRGSVRSPLAVLVGVALVVGSVLLASVPRADTAPVVLSGTARFPDHSSGHEPGLVAANEVGITVTPTTMTPWVQGHRHEVFAVVETEPDSGVASAELATLFLHLERIGTRGFINSDLDLLKPAGPNRWIPMDGPLLLFPNQDVAGTGFLLSFALSLNVEYANGRSYGYGGWDPDIRIAAPDILTDLAPIGMALLGGGAIGAVLLAVRWTSRRRTAPRWPPRLRPVAADDPGDRLAPCGRGGSRLGCGSPLTADERGRTLGSAAIRRLRS
jgi:hypothetical protein